MCLALLLTSFGSIAAPVQAAPSDSITVTKYAIDGTTILDQVTVDSTWMDANLPVQGDGVTHYYHQGPTFESTNMWDPDELINVD